MVEKSLGFKVVKYVQSEGGSAREEVASFAEKWEADEFAKGQSIRRKSQGLEGVRYEVEETAKPKLLAVSPLPKTISEPHQTLGQKPKKKRLTPAQQKRFVQQAGKCSACGITDITILDVHHIRPYAKGGSNRPWNLSVLCPTCHRKAQNGLLTPLALIARPSKGARSQAAAIQEPSQPKTESVQRDANQPSIHLELKPGFMEQGGQISETVVYLEASNRGTVPVFIPSLPSLQILMPDGRHWIPREDLAGYGWFRCLIEKEWLFRQIEAESHL